MLLSQILISADYNPARIRKIDKLCGDELDLKDIKFPVNKIRDVRKIKKNKNSVGISVFGFENKEK